MATVHDPRLCIAKDSVAIPSTGCTLRTSGAGLVRMPPTKSPDTPANSCLPAIGLQVSILLEDAMALRQLVATAYGSGSGLSLMRLKPGSSGILDHAQSPADSDMTEAAEETDAVEQQLELSSAVQVGGQYVGDHLP